MIKLIDCYLDTGLKLLLTCLCNAYSTNERNIIERIRQSGFA